MDNYLSKIDGILQAQHIKLPESKRKQCKPKGKYLINHHQKPKKNRMRYLEYFSTCHFKNPSTEDNSTCQSSWHYDKLKLNESSHLGKVDRSMSVKAKNKQKTAHSSDRLKSENP